MKKKITDGGWFSNTCITLLIIAGLIVGLSNALTGCAKGTSVARVVDGLGTPFFVFPQNSVEYDRFRNSFYRLAANDGFRRSQLQHFYDAYNLILTEYVHQVDERALINSAIQGMEQLKGVKGQIPSVTVIEAALDFMVGSLDPHSQYMNPQEYKESQVATSGQFGGLGIEVRMTDGLIEIISPMADTPAARAGLRSGDLITHVDGEMIKKMTLGSAVRRLRGLPGSKVRITILRSETGSFDIDIVRAIIKVKPVKWYLEGHVGVLRITHFNIRAIDSLEGAIQKIHSNLGSRLKGLVVDLRNNPGGLLNQSVDIADAFLDQGQIVSVRDREGEIRGYKAQYGDIIDGLPMVVLINRGSASASEIVAGALQDHRRATIMGVRSFGKGSVQTIAPLNWDGALRLTTALYYLPSGRTIQGAGVNPDLAISEKKLISNKRESDLPNALVIETQSGKVSNGFNLSIDKCPKAGQQKTDKLLGCALMFLVAGSQETFFSNLNSRRNSD